MTQVFGGSLTGNAHRLFGLALGASAGAIMTPFYGGMSALAVAAMALPGSTAPDWLEIRIGPATLIPHRTVTHWLLPWLGGWQWHRPFGYLMRHCLPPFS
jgi:hypothetical protein